MDMNLPQVMTETAVLLRDHGNNRMRKNRCESVPIAFVVLAVVPIATTSKATSVQLVSVTLALY